MNNLLTTRQLCEELSISRQTAYKWRKAGCPTVVSSGNMCRYNYDECRTKKKLQESTGPGRYLLNVPGNGSHPCFFNDPQIRLQKWGANLEQVVNGAPIDIDSDLTGRTRQLTKYCSKKMFANNGVPVTNKVIYLSAIEEEDYVIAQANAEVDSPKPNTAVSAMIVFFIY